MSFKPPRYNPDKAVEARIRREYEQKFQIEVTRIQRESEQKHQELITSVNRLTESNRFLADSLKKITQIYERSEERVSRLEEEVYGLKTRDKIQLVQPSYSPTINIYNISTQPKEESKSLTLPNIPSTPLSESKFDRLSNFLREQREAKARLDAWMSNFVREQEEAKARLSNFLREQREAKARLDAWMSNFVREQMKSEEWYANFRREQMKSEEWYANFRREQMERGKELKMLVET